MAKDKHTSPRDDPWYNKNKEYAERLAPCLKETLMSRKCLEDNDYDKTKCSDYFKNYIECRKFWDKIYTERKRNKIKPFMPPPEEQEQIKKKHNIIT